MFGWREALAVSAPAATLLTLLIILVILRFHRLSKRGTRVTQATVASDAEIGERTKPSCKILRCGTSPKPPFNWDDPPPLIANAAGNGWSGFASTKIGGQRETPVETTWEVGEKSVHPMQKIRMKKKSVVRTILPLPGPPAGISSSSFPQEAYFEITIVSPSAGGKISGEGVRMMMIGGDGVSERVNQELKLGGLMMAVGFSCSDFAGSKFPGCYRGSVGFNSDGSVNVDGTKVAEKSEKGHWGAEKKVIGCGFDPRRKKVFFTVDSELVHQLHCKSEEFGGPLHAVIAAHEDVTVLVNMGQCSFSYGPANGPRTSNLGLVGPNASYRAALGYEDSGELFSMGRLDLDWGNKRGEDARKMEEDEYEADLFEIILDENVK